MGDSSKTRTQLIEELKALRARLDQVERSEAERGSGEEMLRSSEARLKQIIDLIPAQIFVKDRRGRILLVNRTGAETLGTTPEEMTGKLHADLHPDPEEVEQMLADDRKVIDRRQPVEVPEESYLRADGERRWLRTVKVPYIDSDTAEPALLGVAIDITERKRTEQLLHRQREAINQAFDGIAAVDMDGKLLFVNAAFAAMHGYRPEELVGKHLNVFHTAEQVKQDVLPFIKVTREKGGHRGEVGHVRRDGTTFPTQMSVSVFRGTRGTPVGMIAIARDMSEARRLEAELRHAQKMEAVGQLAAGVAHEFNNLLVGVLVNAEMLLARPGQELPEALRQPLEDIRRSGEGAAALTEQLLSFAQKRSPRLTLVDVNRAIMDRERILQRLAGDRVTLEKVLAADLWRIRVDEAEVEQLIMNLVANARDAMPDGGTVTIRTANRAFDEAHASGNPVARSGPYVELSVADTGCGMSRETADRAFEPFFTTKPVGQGTGLGLSTAFAIVTKAGGHIEIDSRPGEGTVLRAYLPRAPEALGPADAAVAPPLEPAHGGDETILVCDDHEMVLRSVCSVLEGAGYSVIAAENGRRALELASSHAGTISLLLTDVIMPEMDGVQLAGELAQQRPDLKVIYMSGYASDVLESGRVTRVDFEFLKKPAGGNTLLRRVREVLDGTRAAGVRKG
jgi:PAS domain S-box-containing protein